MWGRVGRGVVRSARLKGLLLLLGGALLLNGCGIGYKTHRLRYIMTVEVETPQGLRTGSSAIEVQIIETPFWDAGRPVNFRLRGEAVAVDLPGGRVMFAVLSKPGDADYAIQLPMVAFRPYFEQVDDEMPPDWARRIARLQSAGATVALQGDQLPMFVTFTSPDQPASVQHVSSNDLGPQFGPGFRLRSVRISVTDRQPTAALTARLPWLENYKRQGMRLSGSRSVGVSKGHLADSLGSGSFSVGIIE